MHGPTAGELMSTNVVTVPPETPVMAVARLLTDRGISAVPVTDREGALLGIVTEADLIRRLAGEEDRPASWLAKLFSNPARDADRYSRTHGVRAEDVMTRDVLAVEPGASAAHVATVMEENNVRRLVVAEGGRLKGIVSRGDLLRALVVPPVEGAGLSDDRIRRAIVALMRKEPWADTFYTMVEVHEGVVTFYGFQRSDEVKRGLRVLAEGVPGVREVRDETQATPVYLYATP